MERNERIVFDPEKCVRCGLCVQDCVSRAIRLTEEGIACVRPCLECGHCVAICPRGAVSIPSQDMDEVVEYQPETFALPPENLANAMKYRRSVRAFTPQPVDPAVLREILQAGRYAPTAKNVQGMRFLALQAELPAFKQAFWDAMPEIVAWHEAHGTGYGPTFARFYEKYQEKGRDAFFMDAPAALILAGGSHWDAGVAAGNMELMCCAHGLGALHDGYLQRALLACPRLLAPYGMEDVPVSACLLAGHPKRRYARTAPRKPAHLLVR